MFKKPNFPNKHFTYDTKLPLTSSLNQFFNKLRKVHIFTKVFFWFTTGVFLGILLIVSILYGSFQLIYKGTIYPGILINGANFGGKSPSYVRQYFNDKNAAFAKTTFTFFKDDNIATVSAKKIADYYDSNLLADQAYSLGRSSDILSNISIIIQAYINGIALPASINFSPQKLEKELKFFATSLYVAPVDGKFDFENGRVTSFALSKDGQEIDSGKIEEFVREKLNDIATNGTSNQLSMVAPLRVLHPKISTTTINNLGIKELIGTGTSLFQGSIDSRIYNVELGASRINGVIIKPDEIFSFDQALGDVSALNGYKQAYVIASGHTVLGDGGGICQVSTTFFRAALNAGLPIVERHAHDYRVHYYEEDGPPGIDATIYTPSVDLKIKNDTGHAILVQSVVDPTTLRLTFNFYGTSDGRQTVLTIPIVTNIIPAPPDLNQDDPTLPVGQIKQTDFSANGATVSFSRTVTRNGKTLISDNYTSVYRPWQAVFMHGTKPN